MLMYRRTTQILDFSLLPEPLQQALLAHAGRRELGDQAARVLVCGLTHSQKTRRTFFQRLTNRLAGIDPDPAHDMAILLTPERLFWATHGEKRGQTVLSARLAEIEVRDFTAAGVDDQGLDVVGFFGDNSQKAVAYIALGSEPAAAALRTAIREAVAAAHGWAT